MTGFTEQKPGLVSPLAPPETAMILELTWRSWGYILNKAFTASAEELTDWALESEAWVANRDDIPLCFLDAAPCYLGPSAGTVLVPIEVLYERHLREEARWVLRKGLARQPNPGCVSLRPSGDAMGATRRDKNRLTLVLRQMVSKIFNLPQGQLPEGKHLPSLLIAQAAQPCMLADMSWEEPSIWLRSCAGIRTP